MRALAYIDTPRVTDRHRAAVPDGTAFRQASIPAVDGSADIVYIGPPDPDGALAYHRHCYAVKQKYEQYNHRARGDPDRTEVRIEVVDALEPEVEVDTDQADLEAVVGTRAANALAQAGYGSLEAARALGEEVTTLDGVGETTYEKLHSSDA